MRLSIQAEIPLDGASSHVTTFNVAIRSGSTASRGGVTADDDRVMGTVRVSLVHVGEILDANGDLWPALRAANLESVHDVYFAHDWYKDEYADGAGIDLMVIEDIAIGAEWQGRNLEYAVVRRLSATLGSGCQLAVMRYRIAHEAARWAPIGFTSSTPGRSSGWMHLKLGERNAHVVDASGRGDFEVMPMLLGPRTTTQN